MWFGDFGDFAEVALVEEECSETLANGSSIGTLFWLMSLHPPSGGWAGYFLPEFLSYLRRRKEKDTNMAPIVGPLPQLS